MAATGFVARALADGVRVLYVATGRAPGAILSDLEQDGIAAHRAVAAGQLEVRAAEEAYLAGGGFDRDAMTALLRHEVARARRDGWSGFRVAGEMGWALQRPGLLEDLLEYERIVDDVFAESGAAALCLYDAERFDAATLDAVAAIHPLVLAEPAATPAASDADAPAAWERVRVERRRGGLALAGTLDAENAQSVATSLRREGSITPDLRLDLTQVDHVDVPGGAALAGALREHVERGGTTTVVGAGPDVRELLDAS